MHTQSRRIRLFPILRHQSLNGCKMAAGNRRGDAIYYPLVCDGSNGTTGTAQLHADADRVKGVLEMGAALLERRFGPSRRLFEKVACHP